ncbi:YbaB/EbfC family nucleoid-associated protein [Micromonospora sp. M12]
MGGGHLRTAARAQELSERVAAMSATAEGAHGAVQVTVAASGAMTDLRLDDRVLRWQATEIAAEVLAVMRRAQGCCPRRWRRPRRRPSAPTPRPPAPSSAATSRASRGDRGDRARSPRGWPWPLTQPGSRSPLRR